MADRKPATGKNFGFQKQYLHVGTCTLRLTILPARIPPLSCFEQTHLFEDYFRRISLYDLLNTFTTRERVKWHNFNTVDQKSDTLKINNRWNMIFRIPGEKEGELYRWKKERKYIYIFIFNPRSTESGASWTLISKISQAFKSRSVIECLFAASRFRLTTPTQPTPLRSIDPIGRET